MGVTDPNGDPYSEAGALEDLQSEWRFTIEEGDLEGFEPPGLYVVFKDAMDDKHVVVQIKEPDAGEWELVQRGRPDTGDDG